MTPTLSCKTSGGLQSLKSNLEDEPSCNTCSAMQDLIDSLDRDLTYAVEVEGKMRLAEVSNYNQVLNVVGPLLPCGFGRSVTK